MCTCVRINCKNLGTKLIKGCNWFSKFHVERFFDSFCSLAFLGIIQSMDMELFTFCCLATIYACICLRINKTNPGTGPSRCYYCQKDAQKSTKNSRKLLYLKLKTNSTSLKVYYPRLLQLILKHMHMKLVAMQ